jgi:hypothetical protein
MSSSYLNPLSYHFSPSEVRDADGVKGTGTNSKADKGEGC